MINRADFQALAQLRLEDARALFADGFPDGAFYLAVYAVECALMACIAKRTAQYDFPPSPTDVQRMNTHKLVELVKLAQIETARIAERDRDPTFVRFWKVVESRSEQIRYERRTTLQARELLEAVGDAAHGVLRWI